jgi:hypothetical protein
MCDAFIHLDQVWLRHSVRMTDNSEQMCDWVLRGQLLQNVQQNDLVVYGDTILEIAFVTDMPSKGKSVTANNDKRVVLGLRRPQ